MSPGTPEPAPRCLRCPDVGLELTDRAGPLTFRECPACRRRYTQHEDGVLTERWTGPLGAVVYGVIFDPHPQRRASTAAAGLRPDERRAVLRAIELELHEPSQPIARLHGGMSASEDDLREYLHLVAEAIRARLWTDRPGLGWFRRRSRGSDVA